MDPRHHQGLSDLFWAGSIVAILAVAGVSGWWYSGHRNNPATNTVATTAPAVTAPTDPVLSASTDIQAAVTDIDSQLATISTDINSSNDDAPTF